MGAVVTHVDKASGIVTIGEGEGELKHGVTLAPGVDPERFRITVITHPTCEVPDCQRDGMRQQKCESNA